MNKMGLSRNILFILQILSTTQAQGYEPTS